MVNNAERIKSYIESIKSDFKAISRLKIDEDSSKIIKFKKTLIYSLLDAMSKSIYNKMGNRVKFIKFIDNFSDWKDKDKISFPHLKRDFELNKKCEHINLKKFIDSFDFDDEGYKISLDPEYEQVEILSSKNIMETNELHEELHLYKNQHKYLLYANRNKLIHEQEESGYGMEENDDAEPFYISVTDASKKSRPSILNLVYPLKFYENLCNTCIGNLERHLHAENINPHKNYRFGDYWRPQLNPKK